MAACQRENSDFKTKQLDCYLFLYLLHRHLLFPISHFIMINWCTGLSLPLDCESLKVRDYILIVSLLAQQLCDE